MREEKKKHLNEGGGKQKDGEVDKVRLREVKKKIVWVES